MTASEGLFHVNMDCLFGADCPTHGTNCIYCDVGVSTENLVHWGLEISRNGTPRFVVYNNQWTKFIICKEHFLERMGLIEEDIGIYMLSYHIFEL